MALIFEHERVVYDSEDELLRFFAAEGVLLVRCGISKAALMALEEDALLLIRKRWSRPTSVTGN